MSSILAFVLVAAGDPFVAYERGDFSEALTGFAGLQAERPEDPAVAFNVGNAQYRLGDFAAAQRSFQRATQSPDPRLRERALYNLANAQLRAGQAQQAIQSYEAALALDPKDVDALHNLELARRMLQEQEQQKNQKQDQQQDAPQNSQPERQQQPGEDEQQPQQQPDSGAQQPGAPKGPPSEAKKPSEDSPRQNQSPSDPTSPQAGDQQQQPEPQQQQPGTDPNESPTAAPQSEGQEIQGTKEGAVLTRAQAEMLLQNLNEQRPKPKTKPGRKQPKRDW